jgi:NADH-quinone oxidoreductase subunit F
MIPTYPQILFQNRKPDRIATLAEYRQSGGYGALEAALKTRSSKEIQQALLNAALLGRGGAAFPTGSKLMSVAEDAPHPRYIICNADEMEPGTFKDRVMIHTDPHMLIEGMILAGYAAGADQGIIFIRPEYENAAKILEREIEIAKSSALLGKDILGSDYSLEIEVHRSAGRYICGEVTAQMNALMGKRPNPKQVPPYATEKGLWGQPTVIQNVETLVCIPHILRNGPEWFKSLALTESGAGTKLFCVSGRVIQPGCYELPLGVRLSEIIEVHAGGMLP